MRKATKSEQDRLMAVKNRILSGIKDELAAGEISNVEILALMAQVTGMVIAMQDQRTMTPDQAMDLVARNIEAGNASAVEQLFQAPAGRS